MARTKKVQQVPAHADLDQGRIDSAIMAMRQDATAIAEANAQRETTVRAVAQQLGYQLPADCTDPELIQRDITVHMRRSVEACLEVGRGLAVLKAACEHGEFINRLEGIGIERNVAARFMRAAAKFTNAPTSAHLTKAIGTQSKLLEMLVLDDEQIEELALTGQTGELHLDDVATMSVKELRAAVRELKAEAAAQEKVRGNLYKQIDELKVSKQRRELAPLEEKLQKARSFVDVHRAQLIGLIHKEFLPAIDALRELAGSKDTAVGYDSTAAAAAIAEVILELKIARDDRSLPEFESLEELELQREAMVWKTGEKRPS